LLRGKIKQEIVSVANKLNKPVIMEAEFNALSNNALHRLSDKVRQEKGLPWGEFVFPLWKKWFDDEVAKY